ncbi:MAG: PASTA domain-containing protein [Tumebacillaceae bacterium]
MNERILAGRYRLQDAALGRADLYQADDLSLRRKVAVKRLSGNVSGVNRQHWEQEIAKAAGLHDLHLLSIYDVVIEEDGIYLITEDMEGQILARWIRERSPFAPETAVDIARQLARAVVQAEKHGLQDISIDPNSVLMTRQGFVKVINYGPLYRGGDHSKTPQELVMTAGILLYEMVTGEQYSDLLPTRQVQEEVARSLRTAEAGREWLPRRLELIIGRALRLLPEATYNSVQEFYTDINALHHAIGQIAASNSAIASTATPKRKKSEKIDRVKESVVGSVQEGLQKVTDLRRFEFVKKMTEQSPQRKRSPMYYLLAAMVLVLVCGGLWWTFGDEKSTASTTFGQTVGKEVKMPNLLNKTEEQAYQVLMENGFPEERIQVVYRPTEDTVTKGKVYRQSADPNAQVNTGSMIVLTINGNLSDAPSKGEGNAGQEQQQSPAAAAQGEIPDLKGMTQSQAEQTLLNLGYRYSFNIEKGDTPSGTVFKQDIAPGTQSPKGTRVTFSVSQ